MPAPLFSPLRAAAMTLAVSLLLAACKTTGAPPVTAGPPPLDPAVAQRYVARSEAKGHIAEVDLSEVDPQYLRQVVPYRTTQQPGTVVVDPHNRFLYLVLEHGEALRYGVGVGKAGLEFTGTATVGAKKEWPRWTPTPDMIRREPDRYAKWAGGMAGGEGNPLGPRALYLFENGEDTLYRIHGTTEPWTIGQAVSSGCIRMLNQDVLDLYQRVPAGSKVVVL